MFGYGADSNGNWSHYWEILKNKNLKTGVHAGKYEYDIIWRLAQQQKIKFYEAVMKTIWLNQEPKYWCEAKCMNLQL